MLSFAFVPDGAATQSQWSRPTWKVTDRLCISPNVHEVPVPYIFRRRGTFFVSLCKADHTLQP